MCGGGGDLRRGLGQEFGRNSVHFLHRRKRAGLRAAASRSAVIRPAPAQAWVLGDWIWTPLGLHGSAAPDTSCLLSRETGSGPLLVF